MARFPEHVDTKKVDDGHTPLMIAAANNHQDIVHLLGSMVCMCVYMSINRGIQAHCVWMLIFMRGVALTQGNCNIHVGGCNYHPSQVEKQFCLCEPSRKQQQQQNKHIHILIYAGEL